MLQTFQSRAYLVAHVDNLLGKFVSKAVVTADGPEQAVHKVRAFLTKRGEVALDNLEMQAIELGDVPDTCDLDQPLAFKLGDGFEW